MSLSGSAPFLGRQGSGRQASPHSPIIVPLLPRFMVPFGARGDEIKGFWLTLH
jgi:hypothetical protein